MYAQDTEVPVHRTRQAIEELLNKNKCTQYTIGSDLEIRKGMVQFKAQNRIVRFVVALPDPTTRPYTHDKRGVRRSPSALDAAVQQGERQRWRALLLVIKAKLEAVESQIATFEEEFMAHIVLPNGQTVGEVVIPRIQAAYDHQDAGRLLEARND